MSLTHWPSQARWRAIPTYSQPSGRTSIGSRMSGSRARSAAMASSTSHGRGRASMADAPHASPSRARPRASGPAYTRKDAPRPRTMNPRAADFVSSLGVVAIRLAYFGLTHITYEDSLITLRYAQNLATGHGLVYNPGERLFGASTPLYVLLLSLLCWIGAPAPLVAARWILVAADGLTAVLWCRLLRHETRSWQATALFAVAFGLSPFLVQNCVSGMETSLALLFLTGAFVADHRDRVQALGVFLGLLALVRP